MADDVYLGNPNLKKANTAIEFTQDQILEFIKCKEDPVYFSLPNYISNKRFTNLFRLWFRTVDIKISIEISSNINTF